MLYSSINICYILREDKTLDWKLKKFKELKVEEIYKILELRNEVFIVEQQCAYQDCDGKDEDSYHLFLQESEKIIAYLRILKMKKRLGFRHNHIWLTSIKVLVLKEFRINI